MLVNWKRISEWRGFTGFRPVLLVFTDIHADQLETYQWMTWIYRFSTGFASLPTFMLVNWKRLSEWRGFTGFRPVLLVFTDIHAGQLETSQWMTWIYRFSTGFASLYRHSRRSTGNFSLTGTAGDSLAFHNGLDFSSKDQDNDKYSDGECTVLYKGGWWYGRCHHSNLNGFYYHGPHQSLGDGVNWGAWRGDHYSAKRAEMKIRPLNG